jgi:hypothetical protein
MLPESAGRPHEASRGYERFLDRADAEAAAKIILSHDLGQHCLQLGPECYTAAEARLQGNCAKGLTWLTRQRFEHDEGDLI